MQINMHTLWHKLTTESSPHRLFGQVNTRITLELIIFELMQYQNYTEIQQTNTNHLDWHSATLYGFVAHVVTALTAVLYTIILVCTIYKMKQTFSYV